MKSKVIKTSKGDFAKGGNTKMLPMKGAGPQKPGQTAQAGGGGGKFAKGGNGKMFGKQSAKPAGKC